jgi:hypothetical protein
MKIGTILNIFSLTLLIPGAWAVDRYFGNEKEAFSLYLQKERKIKDLREFQVKVPTGDRISFYLSLNKQLNEKSRTFCEEHWVVPLVGRFGAKNLRSALLDMRSFDYLDDLALKALLEFEEITNKVILLPPQDYGNADLKALAEKVKPQDVQFFKRFQVPGQCLMSTWMDVKQRSQILAERLGLPYSKTLQSMLSKLALVYKHIRYDKWEWIERIHQQDQQRRILTLEQYREKKETVKARLFGAEPRTPTKSAFISDKVRGKEKLTRRERLYLNYTGTQIINMAALFLELKDNLTADAGQIILYRDGEPIFVRDLSEMEIYCTGINVFREGMEKLRLNEFIGTSVQFLDVIAAGYELNVISAEEIEEVVRIEEIWNPKRSTFQKIMTWIEPVGTIGTVLLVPPYNVIFGIVYSVARAVANSGGDQNADRLHNILNCN